MCSPPVVSCRLLSERFILHTLSGLSDDTKWKRKLVTLQFSAAFQLGTLGFPDPGIAIKMLLVVCCVLLVAGWASADRERSMQRRKLRETLKELKDVTLMLGQKDQMLNTPPEDIEDCCSVSALTCFHKNLPVYLNITRGTPRKLYRSLKHRLTVTALDFCNVKNAESFSCQTCESVPQEKAQEFFSRLKSLIQRGMSNLSMD